MIKTIKENSGLSVKLTIPSAIYQSVSRILFKTLPFIPSDHLYNITLCHEKKFIWFRVAKVGTRTIFKVFDSANVALDAEHAMSCHYPVKLYRNYFKFAFVRNPWERLVSCWKKMVVENNHFNFPEDKLLEMQDFKNFVQFVADSDVNKCDHHIRPQSKLIDLNNVDYIGRFENFESDLSEVIRILGLGEIEINKINSSIDSKGYKNYYDESLKQIVADIYSKDIKIFSYDF